MSHAVMFDLDRLSSSKRPRLSLRSRRPLASPRSDVTRTLERWQSLCPFTRASSGAPLQRIRMRSHRDQLVGGTVGADLTGTDHK
jgi:hypothetical protein